MAKNDKKTTVSQFHEKSSATRPGVHSKKKNSVLKSSKNYRKKYVGQGR